MTKDHVRKLKTHFKQRWEIYRHNVKHPDNKKLFLEEKFILRNVLPGPILAYNCLGEMYQGIIPVVTETSTPVSTVLMINPMEFRYATQKEIIDHISKACTNLTSPGRLIININLFIIMYDRLNISLDTYCNTLKEEITKLGFKLVNELQTMNYITIGYGHWFLSFDYE